MKEQSFGKTIAMLRKNKNMTQAEFANLLDVTDKAVSKWERDLCYPDISLFPKISEIFNISIDELMNIHTKKKNNSNLLSLILKAVSLAMFISVFILSLLKKIDLYSGLSMLAIGGLCLLLHNKKTF